MSLPEIEIIEESKAFMIIPVALISSVWAEAREKLVFAIESCPDKHSLEDILRAILEKRSQLWVYIDKEDNDKILAVMVTEILDHSDGTRTLSCPYLGGKNSGFIEGIVIILRELEEFGKLNGCNGIQGCGLPFWDQFEELGNSIGFYKTHILFRKDI